MRISLPLFMLVVLLSACEQEPVSDWKPFSLLKYGVPLTILAPDSVKVEQMDLIVKKDIELKKGDDYYIQLFAADATTTDVAAIKAAQQANVESNPYFSKIIEEKDDGFIYQTAVDTANVNYSFRRILVVGDREYIFQTGLVGKFSLEDVMRMYEAIDPKLN
ncbi:MAG: hypothetical protein AAGG75_21635 [Bacteroidota bacterium]